MLCKKSCNRSGDEEIMSRWEKSNGVTFTKKEDMDIDSFKKAVDGIDDWFVNELKSAGYDDAQDLVDLFTEDSVDTVEDYSDLNWPETTWNFACSTTDRIWNCLRSSVYNCLCLRTG